MGKKISEKIISKHTIQMEGILNVDSLDENVILMDVEELGEIDVKSIALDKFNGKYVKITINETSEEEVPDLDL